MKRIITIACLAAVILCGCGNGLIGASAYSNSIGVHLSDFFPGITNAIEEVNEDVDAYTWVIDDATIDDYVMCRDAVINAGFTENASRSEYFDNVKHYIGEKNGYVYYVWISYGCLGGRTCTAEHFYEDDLIDEDEEELETDD
ncbi:MAG: hypothetical protein ACLTZE_03260 [Evtepia sp.]